MISNKFYVGLLAGLWAISALADDILPSIPNGYRDGRADAVYGSYDTPVNPHAREMQVRVRELEQKVYGFASMTNLKDTERAATVYQLEHELIRLHLDIVEQRGYFADEFERQALINHTKQIYQNLTFHRDRLFEDVVRYLDIQKPGPNGGQFRHLGKDPDRRFYYPNFRSDKLLDEKERKAEYIKLRDKFTAAGGSLDEIQKFTPEVIPADQPIHWMEYVVREKGGLYITKGKAGHVLTAEGKAVAAAGQIVFVMDPYTKKPSLVIVTNASGNYKPDMLSVQEEVGAKLANQLDISPDAIVYTKGEPMTSQMYKLYMKGANVPDDEIKTLVKALETKGKATLARPTKSARGCTDFFDLFQATQPPGQ